MNRHSLLLVSRRDLLSSSETPEGERFIRALARLTRRGYHLVATASQPDEWTRSSAVSKRRHTGPKRIRDRVAEAGGILDGVYYIPQSLLTQRARREEALRDLLGRFATPAIACYMISSNRKLISAAANLGIHTLKIPDKQKLGNVLEELKKFPTQ